MKDTDAVRVLQPAQHLLQNQTPNFRRHPHRLVQQIFESALVHVFLHLIHVPPFDSVIECGDDVAMAHLVGIAQALENRFADIFVRDA